MNGKYFLTSLHFQMSVKKLCHFLYISKADIVAVIERIFLTDGIFDGNMNLFPGEEEGAGYFHRLFLIAVFEDVGKQIGKNPFQHQTVAGETGAFLGKTTVCVKTGQADIFAVFPEILQNIAGRKAGEVRRFFLLGDEGVLKHPVGQFLNIAGFFETAPEIFFVDLRIAPQLHHFKIPPENGEGCAKIMGESGDQVMIGLPAFLFLPDIFPEGLAEIVQFLPQNTDLILPPNPNRVIQVAGGHAEDFLLHGNDRLHFPADKK